MKSFVEKMELDFDNNILDIKSKLEITFSVHGLQYNHDLLVSKQ
jgi:hypothetical protein